MDKIILKKKNRHNFYEALRRQSKMVHETKTTSPIGSGGSESSQEENRPVLDDDSSVEEFVPDVSAYNPELTAEQKEKFFAIHGKVEVAMEDRRQVWLPREFCENAYDQKISYFSDKLAKSQNFKMKLLNELYLPHYGKYRISGGVILGKYYEPHAMQSVTSIAITSDTSYIARGHGNGMVKIWNLSTDAQFLMEPYEDTSRVTKIKFLEHPDSPSLLAVTRQGHIYYCNQKQHGWSCDTYATEEDNEIETMDIARRYKRFITAGSDATIRVYNFESRKIEKTYDSYKSSAFTQYLKCFRSKTLEDEGHYLRLYAVKFLDESSTIFFSGGLDGTIKVWDIRAPAAVENIVGPMLCGDTIDSLGNKVICGQWTSDDSLQIFDVRKFVPESITPTNRLLGSRGEFPYCCRFLRGYENTFINGIDGDLILCGGCGALEIISYSENVVIWALPDDGNVVSVDNAFPFIGHASSAHNFMISTFSPSVRLFKSEIPYADSEEEEDERASVREESAEEEESLESELITDEETTVVDNESYKLLILDEQPPKPVEEVKNAFIEEPLNIINEVILQFSRKPYNNKAEHFKAVWKLARKRILRKWIASDNQYKAVRAYANEQKEVIHNRKHRWCEKTIVLRKNKDGTFMKSTLPATKSKSTIDKSFSTFRRASTITNADRSKK